MQITTLSQPLYFSGGAPAAARLKPGAQPVQRQREMSEKLPKNKWEITEKSHFPKD
jgi:hypothetical protein